MPKWLVQAGSEAGKI